MITFKYIKKSLAIAIVLVLGLAITAFRTDDGHVLGELQQDASLYNTIVEMDNIYFSAYNNCDLDTQAEIYAEDIEFYHDKGGLMTSKAALLESLKNNICGKVTRELVAGSIEVYPIAGYGAVETGMHKFYNMQEPDAIAKPSKFITIWKQEGDSWQITRVISLH